jgi:hypothetical protein
MGADQAAVPPPPEVYLFRVALGGVKQRISPRWGDAGLTALGQPCRSVTGSAFALKYTSDGDGGSMIREEGLGFLDDGPQKPIEIWNRVGRRPLVAGGNSNGDLPMLEFAQHQERPSFRLLVLHDDAEREFAYTSGAEKALAEADKRDWTVVSMKNDFTTVF